MKPKHVGIDSLAYISPTAKIGADVYIAPFAYVGDNAVIADGVQLYPHVTVGENVKIGKNTILYSNGSPAVTGEKVHNGKVVASPLNGSKSYNLQLRLNL